jgi:DNA polymerase (family 10)
VPTVVVSSRPLTNAEISQRLAAHASTLQARGENPYKVRAYRRAAQTVKALRDSMDRLVRSGTDITRFPGIGKGIAAALREIVFSGDLGQLELPLGAPRRRQSEF